MVMGILNVTPDSFSDGGKYVDEDRAVARGLQMVDEGVDIIDVGGQSTRPGSQTVGVAVELNRVIPVVSRLAAETSVPISIDTTDASVARAALDAGAAIINDVSALRFDDEMVAVAVERAVPVILMHMQGTPTTMQVAPRYADVMSEVRAFLRERMDYALGRGVDSRLLMVDIGVGFGKLLEHNLTLLGGVAEFLELGVPVVVGHSRKRFLGDLFGLEVDQRDRDTLAVSSYLAGEGVHVLRVHDVGPTRRAVELIHKFKSSAADGG